MGRRDAQRARSMKRKGKTLINSDVERLRVMQSFAALRATTNPYLKQLYFSLDEYVDVQLFSWRDALAGNFDVLHVHWPEVLLRSGSPRRQWLRRVALMGVMIRIRFSRRVLVRTVHNLEPHELGSPLEKRLLRLMNRWTTLFILLVPDTPVPLAHAPYKVIPHGHYRDWLASFVTPSTEPGRIAYIGLIRRYKGVKELLDVFIGTADEHPAWQLRIVGRSEDEYLTSAIIAAAAADARISARLEYVSDADLTYEVGRAELVVLPYLAMHNSGSALLALSVGRPVLVPRNAVTTALQSEVGRAWVKTYEPPLTARDVSDALGFLPEASDGRGPDLTERMWPTIAEAHAKAYFQAWMLPQLPPSRDH